MNKIIKKWIEPYVLLETLKKDCELVKDFTFDGFSKNVNKFYLFNGQEDIDKIFELAEDDYEITCDNEKPFEMIDMGKAEAVLIKL